MRKQHPSTVNLISESISAAKGPYNFGMAKKNPKKNIFIPVEKVALGPTKSLRKDMDPKAGAPTPSKDDNTVPIAGESPKESQPSYETTQKALGRPSPLALTRSVLDSSQSQHIRSGRMKSSKYDNTDELSLRDNDEVKQEEDGDDGDMGGFSEALKFFNLWNEPEPCDGSDSQLSPRNGNGNGSSTASTVSSLGTSFSSYGGSSIFSNALGNGSESSESTQVSVEDRPKGKLENKPTELICWFAATGVRCKGKIGYSPEARRLLRYVPDFIERAEFRPIN